MITVNHGVRRTGIATRIVSTKSKMITPLKIRNFRMTPRLLEKIRKPQLNLPSLRQNRVINPAKKQGEAGDGVAVAENLPPNRRRRSRGNFITPTS